MTFRGACSIARNSGPAWLNTWCVVAEAPHPLAVDCANPGGTHKHNKSAITGPVGGCELWAAEGKCSSIMYALRCAMLKNCRSEIKINSA